MSAEVESMKPWVKKKGQGTSLRVKKNGIDVLPITFFLWSIDLTMFSSPASFHLFRGAKASVNA